MQINRASATYDPAELRRENHRRRVLAHMEKTAREVVEPRPQAAQFKVPLIGEARRPESEAKPPRARTNGKLRTQKAAQLDLGV